jgi:serine/threonine-protein kinase
VQSFVPDALVGRVLDGRYRLRSHLASGGMGAIFRAEHVYLRNDVAVKLLRPELSALPDLAERFRREAEIAASLEHENIVRVTDFGRTPEGWLFLAMELLQGESLFDRMRDGPLAAGDALPILAQVCEGLAAAHARGVVHRDLKPENVFLCRAPRPWVKLLDFGIAKIVDGVAPGETAAGVVVGTPEYASPEQASGSPVDGRADIYALGLVAWQVLAGRHPFRAEDSRGLLMMQATVPVPPLTEARPDLADSPGLLDAVARACAKDPAERFQSADELRDALLAALPADTREAALAPPRTTRGTPLSPGRAGTAAPAARRWGRRAAAAGIALGVAVTATVVAIAARVDGATKSASTTTTGTPTSTSTATPTPTSTATPTPTSTPAAAAAAAAARHAAYREAAAHLAAGRPAAARQALQPALARDPDDPRAQALLGRALRRTRGEAASAALTAFEIAARTPGALDRAALEDVAALLLADRRTSERAARLLGDVGRAASAPVAEVALRASGARRLRVLDVLRAVGGEGELSPTEAYAPLLTDPDCAVRQTAARRLGASGDRNSLPALRALALARRDVKGLVFTRQEPVCGAAEAAEAVRRIAGPRRAASP